jgi:hypothetical protein
MAERRMTIHFIDGTSLPLQFPQQDASAYNLTQRVHDLLKDQYMLAEVDGSLMVFPLAGIKYVQVSPAPDMVPANALKGASLAE